MNTLHPTQIGFSPTGSQYGSQIVLGRNLGTTWEAIGFGSQGRPDVLERIYMNISQVSGIAAPAQKAIIAFDVQSLLNVIVARPRAPTTGFYFSLREYLVCDNGTSKAALFLSSQPYPTGA